MMWLSGNSSFSEVECEQVHTFNRSDQCEFIRDNVECHEDENYVHYSTFVYCAFGSGEVVPALLVLILWTTVLFIGLGVTADDFLTPSLIVISKSLRLSQNIAGVTFLAFGNGAPDIISSLAGVGAARPELVIGELFGAGIFVTCVVAGSICMTQNFKIMERPFLRDVIFYIGATYWAFCMFYKRTISLLHSVGFIMLYLVYITVVVVSSTIYKRHKRKLEEEMAKHMDTSSAYADESEVFDKSLSTLPIPATDQSLEYDRPPEDNPEMMGLVLRRSSFRHSYVQRRKRTLSGGRSRSNSRVSHSRLSQSVTPNRSRATSVCSATAHSRGNSLSPDDRRYRVANGAARYGDSATIASLISMTAAATASALSSYDSGDGRSNGENRNNHRIQSLSAPQQHHHHHQQHRRSSRRRDGDFVFNSPAFTLTAPSPATVKDDSPYSCSFEASFDVTGSAATDSARAGQRNELLINAGDLPSMLFPTTTREGGALPPEVGVNQSTEEPDAEVNDLTPFAEFVTQISPIDKEDWAELNWFWRIFQIVKAPVYVILALTTPVVDEDNNKANWCRVLNTLHCITAPLSVLFNLGGEFVVAQVGGVPVAAVLAGIGVVLALVVWFTSSYDKAPTYHVAFGYVGFVVSVFWIYMLANEVVSLLKAVGIVLRLSDAFLGMTVLAWGNSIGDFISNLSVARQGYPRMAISACFGGPLLNLLLGFGLPYTYNLTTRDSPNTNLNYNMKIGLMYATLCQSLVSTLVIMFILGFHSRREFGGYLISLYCVFFVAATALELLGID